MKCDMCCTSLYATATSTCCCVVAFTTKVALRALLRTAREVAQGMLHMHEANVVHGGEMAWIHLLLLLFVHCPQHWQCPVSCRVAVAYALDACAYC
jgi:hypothetical protein